MRLAPYQGGRRLLALSAADVATRSRRQRRDLRGDEPPERTTPGSQPDGPRSPGHIGGNRTIERPQEDLPAASVSGEMQLTAVVVPIEGLQPAPSAPHDDVALHVHPEQSAGSVQLANLGTTYWIDNTTPPTNVTDASLQGEVVNAIGHVGLDASTVYEVFLPPTSYASFSTYDSCGGPNLTFCAYHGNFTYAGIDVKYASMPYPSCGEC